MRSYTKHNSKSTAEFETSKVTNQSKDLACGVNNCTDPQALKLIHEFSKNCATRYFSCERLTLLHKAVICNNPEIVKLLLEYGADVAATCSEGTTPLEYLNTKLCADSDPQTLEIIKNFVNHDKPLKTISYHNALRFGSKEIVRVILQSNINLSSRDKIGQTPIHYLVKNRYDGVIDELHGKNFDVNAFDCNGMSLLYNAIVTQLPSTVEFLLNHGADPDAQDSKGRTALCATYELVIVTSTKNRKMYRDLIELLFAYGADPRIQLPTLLLMIMPKYIYAFEPILGQLALMEERGTIIGNNIVKMINRYAITKDCFTSCRQRLNTLKTVEIDGSLTLYQLLMSSDSKIEHYARNSNIVSKVKSIVNDGNSYEPFGLKILKRFEQAAKMNDLKEEAAYAFCDLNHLNYNACFPFIEKLFGYLSRIDLQCLCAV